MTKAAEGYRVEPFPRIRLPMVDGGRLGRQRHTIHGLAEVDITDTRKALRSYRLRTGQPISFTAYIVACIGHAVGKYSYMNAYRNWRNQLITFDDVDVSMFFEVEVDGKKLVRPHVLRGVNRRSFQDIHEEIRTFQTQHHSSVEARAINYFVMLPGIIRRFIYWLLFRNPPLMKKYMGTVSLTALGMFGTGGFWGIPVPNHTLQITVGGIAEKPGVVNGEICVRKYLSVTVSLDHDIVDGAPAVRFVSYLKGLIESGWGLA